MTIQDLLEAIESCGFPVFRDRYIGIYAGDFMLLTATIIEL